MKILRLTPFFLVTFAVAIAYSSPLRATEQNQSITIAWEANARSLDPREAVDANSQYLENLVHCSLIDFDANGNLRPYLAKQLPIWKSATELEIEMRKDAKFSDGSPVQADDVRATYESLQKNRGFARSGAFQDLISVKAVGPHKLTMQLQQADASFISNLVIGILPKDASKSKSLAPKVSSCGPFQMKGTAINTISLQRNPHYSLGPKPKIAEIEIKVVKSEKTRFAKLRAGEIDLAQNNISRDLIPQIEQRYPKLKVLKRSALKTTYLGFNMKDPIVNKVEVRQAIAHAINKKAIIEHLLNGLAEPAITLLPPQSAFRSDALTVYDYNPNKAKQLLDQAGLVQKGKFRFELSYKTTIDATRIIIAKAIASQLKAVGIKVKVEPMEWGRFKSDVEQGRVQMWSLSWVGFKDPDIYRYAFSSELMPPNGGNRGRFKNAELDRLLEEGRQTTAPDKRQQIYARVQQLVNQQLPYVFLWHEQNFAVINKDIEGFKLFADGRLFSLTQAIRR